jgi:hypothetical protein
MGTPHHQQSLHRKVLYIGLILAIFFVLVFYRPYVVDEEAKAQSLRDEDRGDVELTGKVVTLGLSGLRGVMITALWSSAKDKMEKNQWNELELLVRSVTKLQPHFVTPWLFQSWNLSYNVAVQCDREADQYFYITRGIELLSEGERQNRYNPEMRYYVGFYNQQKIMLADRTSMLAALYHMSCIDPVQRDPRRFRKPSAEGRVTLDMVEFEKFCQEQPQLVRRLREKVRCNFPEDIVQFLDENRRVPSLYEDDPERMKRPWRRDEQTKLRPVAEQFPTLPPPSGLEFGERQDKYALTYKSTLDYWVDAYLVARAWYSYAVEPLPPPDWIPGRFKPITNPAREKLPRFTTQLFRDYPARAQSYVAERLEQDGWYDDKGWLIAEWFPRDQFLDGRPARVGGGRAWASQAWQDAFDLWRDIGEKHHLWVSPEEDRNIKVKAEAWAKEKKPPAGIPPPELPEEEVTDEGMRAFIFLWNYEYYRRLTNFPHFLAQAQVFGLPATVEARRHFYLAEEAKSKADRRQAIEEYELALRLYNGVLKEHPEFRTDGHIAEEALDFEMSYLNLCRELQGRQWKQAQAIQAFLGLANSGPSPVPDALMLAQLARPHLLPDSDINGPLDDTFGVAFMNDYRRIKNPNRGPPPGVDVRQMMLERGMDMGRLPPGVQLPKNIQAPPSSTKTPSSGEQKSNQPPAKK